MLAFVSIFPYISIWREPNNEEMRSIFEFGSERQVQNFFGSERQVLRGSFPSIQPIPKKLYQKHHHENGYNNRCKK